MNKLILFLFIGLFSVSVYANNKQYETETPIAKKDGGKRVSRLVSL